MKIRMLRMVILFCLGLPGVSIGATDAAQTDELKITETGGAGASESDAAGASESDAAEASESDAAEAGESDAAEAGESDAVEAGESDAVEAGESDAAEAGESDAAEAGESDAAEAGESDAAEAGESDAAEAGESDAAETGESDAAEAGESDAVEAGESDAAEAGESDAAEAEDGGGGGILSTILQWFQGRNLDTDPEGEQAQARQQGREADGKEVTLSHVYQAIRNLIAEIEILRQATGVVDAPPEADPREEQAPIHAYSKSLEVMEKTARVQRRLGMIPVEVGPIPVKRITPQDVHRNVQAIIEELRRVKRQLVIEDEIQPAPFAGGKTPSLLYKNLGDASFLLDGLVGRPTTSNDAYMHVLRVHDELELIAAKLGVALESDPLMVESKERTQGSRSADSEGHVQGHQPAVQAGYGRVERPQPDACAGHSGGSHSTPPTSCWRRWRGSKCIWTFRLPPRGAP